MSSTGEAHAGERLQKVLAGAGLGSRRACEELIADGRVSVNGSVVDRQGTRIDPDTDVVRVDGMRVATAADRVYVAFNKPRGVLTAMSDSRGRPTVADYLAARTEYRQRRLFHVGRLDQDSEGLLLLTNDGDLAHRLAHPSYGVPKTYVATVPGPIPRDLGRRLRAGVDLEDGRAAVDRFAVLDTVGRRAMVQVVLHEGRKRIVRRMLAAVGHPVERLVRTDFGPVSLDGHKPGDLWPLDRIRIGKLFELVDL